MDIKKIDEFRQARPAGNLSRTITQFDLVSFNKKFASITLEFECGGRRGDQSQIWVRFPGAGAFYLLMFPYRFLITRQHKNVFPDKRRLIIFR